MKALVIKGRHASGKSILARTIAEIMEGEPTTLIIDCIPNQQMLIEIENIIKTGTVICQKRGVGLTTCKAPRFIFCAEYSEDLSLLVDNKLFHVIYL